MVPSPPLRRHPAATVSVLIGLLLAFSTAAAPVPKDPLPAKPSDLFVTDHVWTIHLTLAPDQWSKLEPKPKPYRRPAGSGLANLLESTLFREADRDHDRKLSRQELINQLDLWFPLWDSAHLGKLDQEHLRVGLNTAIDNPAIRAGINLLGPAGSRNGLAAAFGIEFEYVHADLEFAGHLLKNVALRYKGNGTYMESRGSLKHSLKISLNHFEKGQKLAGLVKLNLHNNVADKSWMNEVLSHRLYRDAGVTAPRTSYAKVYVSVPGRFDHKYLGLYSIVEDPDKHFAKELLPGKKGAIFKPVTPALFADLGDDWTDYNQIYDPKTELAPAQQQRVIDFARLLTSADDQTFAARIADFLDLDQFARYMAVTTYLSTLDSVLALGQNFYLYLDPTTNRFRFVPWDLDHSFGYFPMIGTPQEREELSILHPWRGDVRLLDRVFRVPAFKTIYLDRMKQFSTTIFQPTRFHEQVDHLSAILRPAVQEESADLLSQFNSRVADPKPAPPSQGGFLSQLFGHSDRDQVKAIKGFVDARSQSVLDQLSGKSTGRVLPSLGFGSPGRISPQAFGPGNFLSGPLMERLDANRDKFLTRQELVDGFSRWFSDWDTTHANLITRSQLRSGLEKSFSNAPPPAAPSTSPMPR